MGLSWPQSVTDWRIGTFFAVICMFSCLKAAEPLHDPAQAHRIRQMIRQGHIGTAINFYRQNPPAALTERYEILRQLALAVIELDANSTSEDKQRISLICAGLSADEDAFRVVEKALSSRNPILQLMALQILCKFENSKAEAALKKAMSSPFPIIRLETASLMAKGRFPCALEQAECLLQKLPEETYPLFAELYACIGTEPAKRQLRILMNHSKVPVRIAAVNSIAEHNIESFAPQVKSLAMQVSPHLQEACATALGKMGCTTAIPQLKKLMQSKYTETALSAAHALHTLGDLQAANYIYDKAKLGNTFAITLLGEMDGSQDFLYQLTKSRDATIRVNASIALLRRRDQRAAQHIVEWLTPTHIKGLIVKNRSEGKSLLSFKFLQLDETGIVAENNLELREQMLNIASGLPDDGYFTIAETLISKKQNDLLPAMFHIIRERSNERSLEFLKKYCQQPGYPLLRTFCNLVLLQKQENGPYRELVEKWVEEQWSEDLLSFRPVINSSMDGSTFQLKPHEKTMLFLSCLEVIASLQSEDSLDFILRGLSACHPNLRSLFATLLIRAIQ